jgi:hypothetical protein
LPFFAVFWVVLPDERAFREKKVVRWIELVELYLGLTCGRIDSRNS